MNESKLALGLRDRAIAHGGDALLLDAAAAIERLTAQRDALLELVAEMDLHEGAEGWSDDLRTKINAAYKAGEA